MSMKHVYIIIILLFFGKVTSQTERYIYRTKVNPDTINLVDMKVETTFLDVKNNQSLFISESQLLRDSLRSVLRQQENPEIKKNKKDRPEFPMLANGKWIQPTFFDYFITKDYAAKTVNLVENIGSKQIYYQEDRKLNWNIAPETTDYSGYKVQKATVDFGGRTWTAWFAPEIKIPDGPYKLSGLPGLILKLEDDKGDYKFNFVKKISIPNSFGENIKPDARKSTRINFQGDKASVRMEMVNHKDSEMDLSHFNGDAGGRGMHQRGGGMNGGFEGGQQHGNGMSGGRRGGAMGSRGFPAARLVDHAGKSGNLTDFTNTNPIELSNK